MAIASNWMSAAAFFGMTAIMYGSGCAMLLAGQGGYVIASCSYDCPGKMDGNLFFTDDPDCRTSSCFYKKVCVIYTNLSTFFMS